MSINAIAAVFQLDLPPLSKWVLVCLADNADPFGGNIFPTITTLSQKSSIPERTLQRHLKALVESRVLEVVRVAQRPTKDKRGRGTEYRLSFMSNPMAQAPRPNYQSCPPKLRVEVIEAFQETCSYCGRKGGEKDPDGQSWHIDRIVPGSRGGAYSPENITLSCGKCNIRKGATMAPVPAQDMGAKRIEMGAKTTSTGATAMAPDPLEEPLEEPSIDPSGTEPPFCSPEFRSALKDFEQHRREKRVKVTPTARRLMFKKFTAWGEARSIAALIYSTEKNYTGCFEENGNGKNQPRFETASARNLRGNLEYLRSLQDNGGETDSKNPTRLLAS